jgi:hypothetical protein
MGRMMEGLLEELNFLNDSAITAFTTFKMNESRGQCIWLWECMGFGRQLEGN